MPEIIQFGNAISLSGLFGCKRPEQGQVFAIQCMFERKPPLEMAKTYHVVGDKLVKRADAMLADFRRAGGKWKWADLDATDKQEALVAWEGEEYRVSYSIDQARAAGLVKEGSNWTKDPATMLRARVVSRTLRAIAPEMVQGVYTEADLDGSERDRAGDERAPYATSDEPRNVTPVAEAQAKLDKQAAQPAPAPAKSIADDPFTSPPPAAATDADAVDVTDYNVIPIGPNAGKTWMDLDRATLERVLADPRTLSAQHIAAVKAALERQPF